MAEAYPELKSNEHFCSCSSVYLVWKNGIADRRELYNEAVNINNVRVEQFPDALIAGMFHFKQLPLLEFAEQENTDVDIKKLFG